MAKGMNLTSVRIYFLSAIVSMLQIVIIIIFISITIFFLGRTYCLSVDSMLNL